MPKINGRNVKNTFFTIFGVSIVWCFSFEHLWERDWVKHVFFSEPSVTTMETDKYTKFTFVGFIHIPLL